jgi:hypothetical protein
MASGIKLTACPFALLSPPRFTVLASTSPSRCFTLASTSTAALWSLLLASRQAAP